jgi:hypothetical protein
LGTAGIAALELLAGICVALFFTLWDLSIQEQIPPRSISRVSAYDFSVSVGLMPLGMAVCGPIADAIGLHATLRWMSAVGIAAALVWLVQPSVRALRRPEAPPPAAPAPEPVAVAAAPARAPPTPPTLAERVEPLAQPAPLGLAAPPDPLAQPAGRGWFAWLVAAGIAAAVLSSRRRPG